MIEIYDFIQFFFKHSYPGITTRLENLHLDLGGHRLTFFNLFLNYIIIITIIIIHLSIKILFAMK